MRRIDQFYVLWRNKAGLPVWSGPYDSFAAATHSTAMMDRESGAFVTKIDADNNYSVKLKEG